MKHLDQIMEALSWRVSQVAQVALVTVMALIVANVLIRIPWKPIPGTVEMVEILGSILLGLGIAYCHQRKGHIAVGVLVNRFSRRKQALVDSITGLLALIFMAVLSYQMLQLGESMLARGYTTGHLEIPIAPFIYLVGVGFIMLSLIILRDFIKAVIIAAKGSELR